MYNMCIVPFIYFVCTEVAPTFISDITRFTLQNIKNRLNEKTELQMHKKVKDDKRNRIYVRER